MMLFSRPPVSYQQLFAHHLSKSFSQKQIERLAKKKRIERKEEKERCECFSSLLDSFSVCLSVGVRLTQFLRPRFCVQFWLLLLIWKWLIHLFIHFGENERKARVPPPPLTAPSPVPIRWGAHVLPSGHIPVCAPPPLSPQAGVALSCWLIQLVS
jgi:hypothetical protein